MSDSTGKRRKKSSCLGVRRMTTKDNVVMIEDKGFDTIPGCYGYYPKAIFPNQCRFCLFLELCRGGAEKR
jgi:hypothetical protein